MASMAQSQNPNLVENESQITQQCVSVWAIGGQLNVDVGNGERVAVPNTSGQPPTRKEIYEVLVAAGYQNRANELADRAYINMTEPAEDSSEEEGEKSQQTSAQQGSDE